MANKPKPKPKQERRTNRSKPEQRETGKGKQGTLNRVGALWLSEGRNGKFFSGRIELTEGQEVRILVFKNNYKEESKHPDYIIYEPETREEDANRNKAAKNWQDDDIPF
jgi:serine/threonine-protein kinase RIO1